jgi:small-conductance mechanosensitive channel
MKYALILLLVAVLFLTGAAGPNNDFALIDRVFDDIKHTLGRVNELTGTLLLVITGILGLVAELGRRIRKAQKEAAIERQAIAAEQRDHLSDVKTAVAEVPGKVSEVAATVAADLAKGAPITEQPKDYAP